MSAISARLSALGLVQCNEAIDVHCAASRIDRNNPRAHVALGAGLEQLDKLDRGVSRAPRGDSTRGP